MASGFITGILEILLEWILPEVIYHWFSDEEREDRDCPTIWAPITTTVFAILFAGFAYSEYRTALNWVVWVMAMFAALLAGLAYLLFWRWLECRH